MSVSHLSVHSHYSLLDGIARIDALVGRAAEYGMPALALTDRNNLYGAIEFYKACEKRAIKPIIGVDLDIEIDVRTRLILLAETTVGYHNLVKLVSSAHLSHKGDPHATEAELEKYHEGLVVLVPGDALASGGKTLAEKLKRIFQDQSLFARLEWNVPEDVREQHRARIEACALAPVAAADVYYLNGEDLAVRDTVRKIADPNAGRDPRDLSFIHPDVFEERYRTHHEARENMEAIVERANIQLDLGSWILPEFPLPGERATYDSELKRLAEAGFKGRNMKRTHEAEARLAYELDIIEGKGYSSYFLAVADLLSFAREHGILTTTRGSAAGSLVSYLTGITNIDPLEYALPFERFLNPERPKAPDIDMDIADTRRDEMIRYAKERYGTDHVAQIGTFGTLMARAAVRDVARALGYPYGVGDRIAKLIPFGSQGFPMTIARALEIEEDLKRLYRSDEDVETIINMAQNVEGNARHVGVHAAGVVIAPGAVTDYAPIQWDPHGESVITQYDMYAITDEYGGVGLLKFDFLGLKNLSVLGDAISRVRVRAGERINVENIPIDDHKTFTMLARGNTEGVFQLGGGGMTRYLKELKPTTIHDINAMVALYRPGPMESIPAYIARKHNPELVEYLDPRMKDILERSFGIVTYQDDVLMIAVEIAGYSWLEADALRKAMGKKIPAEMEAQKEKFIDGCVEHGKLSVAKAQEIWKLIEPFAAYGFNKAHAASYGKVAYQTAYMKANHTADYMAALMTADAGNTDRIAVHVGECIRLGIQVLPPDINESDATFTVIDDTRIRFGLTSIKNFGGVAAEAIMDERKTGGPFASLGDLASRVPQSAVNRRGFEALIKAGALDAFGDRSGMVEHLDDIVAAQGTRAPAPENQTVLFTVERRAPVIDVAREGATALADKLQWEKELLGIYVSGHPVDQYANDLARYEHSIRTARAERRKGYPLVIGGVVESAKTILTKRGERMGFFTITDRTDAIEAVAFPKVYQKTKEALQEGQCILLKGKVSYRNDEPSILIDTVKKLG